MKKLLLLVCISLTFSQLQVDLNSKASFAGGIQLGAGDYFLDAKVALWSSSVHFMNYHIGYTQRLNEKKVLYEADNKLFQFVENRYSFSFGASIYYRIANIPMSTTADVAYSFGTFNGSTKSPDNHWIPSISVSVLTSENIRHEHVEFGLKLQSNTVAPTALFFVAFYY